MKKNNHFENIVEKGDNAGNQHFLLFPQFFLLVPKQISIFQSDLVFVSSSNLDQSKNLLFGKELNQTTKGNSLPNNKISD